VYPADVHRRPEPQRGTTVGTEKEWFIHLKSDFIVSQLCQLFPSLGASTPAPVRDLADSGRVDTRTTSMRVLGALGSQEESELLAQLSPPLSATTATSSVVSVHPPNGLTLAAQQAPWWHLSLPRPLLLLLLLQQSLVQQPPPLVLLRQWLDAPLPRMQSLLQRWPCLLHHLLRLFRPHPLQPLALQLFLLGPLVWSRSQPSPALYAPRLVDGSRLCGDGSRPLAFWGCSQRPVRQLKRQLNWLTIPIAWSAGAQCGMWVQQPRSSTPPGTQHWSGSATRAQPADSFKLHVPHSSRCCIVR
jgi:hypothetical protein